MDAREVADRTAITDLLNRYALCIDSLDWATLRTLFTPDAVLDYTDEGGPRGDIETAIAWLSKMLSRFSMCQHFVTNIVLDIDGDDARGRAYVYSPLGTADGKGGMRLIMAGGWYEDHIVRDGDRWLFAERVAKSTFFYAGIEGLPRPPIAKR